MLGRFKPCSESDPRLSDARKASSLVTATGVVSVSASSAPSAGQVLTATNSTTATWQTPSAVAPGGLNVGTATIDFGSFPGASDASVAVTGQTEIAVGSIVNAWIYPTDSADHTADEHRMETISVCAGEVVEGTGFTIWARNTSQLNEPLIPQGSGVQLATKATTTVVTGSLPSIGGRGTLIYGTWNVAWSWS